MKNLEEKIIAVLQMYKDEKLTVNEISQCAAEIGSKYNKSKTFSSSVSREKNLKNNWVYFISQKQSVTITPAIEVKELKIEITQDDELSLYPILNQYLRHIGIRSKRINEKNPKIVKGLVAINGCTQILLA